MKSAIVLFLDAFTIQHGRRLLLALKQIEEKQYAAQLSSEGHSQRAYTLLRLCVQREKGIDRLIKSGIKT